MKQPTLSPLLVITLWTSHLCAQGCEVKGVRVLLLLLSLLLCCFVLFVFDKGYHCVAKDYPEFLVLLSLPPKDWTTGWGPPHPARNFHVHVQAGFYSNSSHKEGMVAVYHILNFVLTSLKPKKPFLITFISTIDHSWFALCTLLIFWGHVHNIVGNNW